MKELSKGLYADWNMTINGRTTPMFRLHADGSVEWLHFIDGAEVVVPNAKAVAAQKAATND